MNNRFEEIEELVRREPDEEPAVRGRVEETDDSGFLDVLDEALLKDPHLLEKGLEAAEKERRDWKKRSDTPLPGQLGPLLKFKIFNDVVLGAEEISGEPKLGEKQGLSQFKKLAEKESAAEADPYLPTIGTEVEIPHSFPIRGNHLKLFEATRSFVEKTGSVDEEWEFAVPYTYSADAQNAYLHELIRGNYIPTEESEGKKGIIAGGKGRFPLHVNVEIPEEITQNRPADGKDPHQDPFHIAATRFSFALSTAFSSPERIAGKAYVDPVHWGNSAERSKPKRGTLSAAEGDETIRRMEIRSLEVRDQTLYRLLHEAQTIAVALFSEFRPRRDETEEELSEIWERFNEASDDLARRYGVSPFGLDYGRAEQTRQIVETLRGTDLQKEMRSLITSFSREIQEVLDEARKKRQKKA